MEVIDKLLQLVSWQFLMLIFFPWLIRPLGKLLSGLGAALGKANTIEIGGVKLGVTEVNNAITERDILKYGILISTSDHNINPKEVAFLKQIALYMGSKLEELSAEEKNRVLTGALNTAASDKDITDDEYRILKRMAKGLGIYPEDLDEKIMDWCDDMNADPPHELRIKYDQRKQPWGRNTT